MYMIRSVHHPAYKFLIAELKKARETRGLGSREVAERIGMPQSVVAKIELRVRKLSLMEYLQYTDALEMSQAEAWELMKRMHKMLN